MDGNEVLAGFVSGELTLEVFGLGRAHLGRTDGGDVQTLGSGNLAHLHLEALSVAGVVRLGVHGHLIALASFQIEGGAHEVVVARVGRAVAVDGTNRRAERPGLAVFVVVDDGEQTRLVLCQVEGVGNIECCGDQNAHFLTLLSDAVGVVGDDLILVCTKGQSFLLVIHEGTLRTGSHVGKALNHNAVAQHVNLGQVFGHLVTVNGHRGRIEDDGGLYLVGSRCHHQIGHGCGCSACGTNLNGQGLHLQTELVGIRSGMDSHIVGACLVGCKRAAEVGKVFRGHLCLGNGDGRESLDGAFLAHLHLELLGIAAVGSVHRHVVVLARLERDGQYQVVVGG